MEREVVINRILAFVALAGVAILGPLALRPAGADFAQQGSYGGVSSGVANAQVISLANVAAMSQLRGVTISFMVGAGLTNTGPAMLGVNSLSPVAVERMEQRHADAARRRGNACREVGRSLL